MKIFILKITLGLCGMLFTFNCQSQYKYDFGVKLSTFRVDGIELEQRIHFKSGYTFSASFNRGGMSDG
jgi:hypothetical protein